VLLLIIDILFKDSLAFFKQLKLTSTLTFIITDHLILLLFDFLLLLGLFLFLPLPHSEESNHLLSGHFDREELGNAEVILALLKVLYVLIALIVITRLNLSSSCLERIVLGLLLVMRLRKLGVDDGKSQVQQEERSDEHQRQEVDEDVVHVGPLHHTLDVTPTFKGH